MAFDNGSIIYLANIIRNKDKEGNDMTAAEWSALITANSQKMFTNLLGVPDLYQLNAPVERRGANVSRRVDEMLSPFYKREVVNAIGGVADFSSKDIGYLLGIVPSTISGRQFVELQPDMIGNFNGSAVIAPTADDPAFEWRTDNSILIYPSTLSSVVLYYYAFPTDADVVFTTDATTLLKTYNAGSSTETGWNKREMVEIAICACVI